MKAWLSFAGYCLAGVIFMVFISSPIWLFILFLAGLAEVLGR